MAAPPRQLPIPLTQPQRRLLAELAPNLADRLQLDATVPRLIPFTPAELKAITKRINAALPQARPGLRNMLWNIREEVAQAPARYKAPEQVYQLKITLRDTQPPIWRRIQVPDCTLDRLHEYIQTAMGWTNSHLDHFRIGAQMYGAPDLLSDNFEDLQYADSTRTTLSAILAQQRKRFRFEYEYDFGDSWEHEVLFEGSVPAEPGQRYPVCVAGARACPPEDVGGVWGYDEFLQALADPDHDSHHEMRAWIGRRFHPEAFDARKATTRMRRGLPDWRS